jgi:hypothetical protein
LLSMYETDPPAANSRGSMQDGLHKASGESLIRGFVQKWGRNAINRPSWARRTLFSIYAWPPVRFVVPFSDFGKAGDDDYHYPTIEGMPAERKRPPDTSLTETVLLSPPLSTTENRNYRLIRLEFITKRKGEDPNDTTNNEPLPTLVKKIVTPLYKADPNLKIYPITD